MFNAFESLEVGNLAAFRGGLAQGIPARLYSIEVQGPRIRIAHEVGARTAGSSRATWALRNRGRRLSRLQILPEPNQRLFPETPQGRRQSFGVRSRYEPNRES